MYAIRSYYDAVHQRTLDDVQGALRQATHLIRIAFDVPVDSLDQRMDQTVVYRQRAPLLVAAVLLLGAPLELLRHTQQLLCRIFRSVQNDILYSGSQAGVDFVVDTKLPRVDDGHVEASLNRVIEKDRMNRLTDPVLAAERERNIAERNNFV